MTFNLRLNIQKTQHTEKQRTSFLKDYVENTELHKLIMIK